MPKPPAKKVKALGKAEQRVLTRRSYSIISHLRVREKKANRTVDFSIAELRERIQQFYTSGGICAYCAKRVRTTVLSLDHIQPSSRGGQSTLSNMALCCLTCNKAKGVFTGKEYQALLRWLDTLPPLVKGDTLARLKLGGAMKGKFSRRSKK